MIDRIVDRNECVGCKACGDVCPKNAIEYVLDDEGFWYPCVNEDKCIHCGLCERVCPLITDKTPQNRTEPDVFAIYNKNKDIRYNSTSGGLYYAIAKAFVDNGGYLVGCSFTEDYMGAYHTIVNDDKGLMKLIRSKYFQSDTEGIYLDTKKLLDKGEKVLFSGTPCQVAALYSFLGKEYLNLYTVDFVCLGVNTPLAYKYYIEELEKKYHSQIEEVHFKNKSKGWKNLGTFVRFKNGKTYYGSRYNDPWINAYIIGNLYMRKGCLACKYKSFPRVSDISYGDFWGPEFKAEDDFLGVSLAMINSERGNELIRMCGESIEIEKRTLEEALKGNPAILQSAIQGKGRTQFFEMVKTEPYSKAVWTVLDKKWPKWWIEYNINRWNEKKSQIKRKIKNIIK